MKKYALLVVAGLAIAFSVSAFTISFKGFRTTAYFIGVTQGNDEITSNPQFDDVTIAGWNLVNLAMGRNATNFPGTNQVLAIMFDCNMSSAHLAVVDRSSSSILVTIAESTSMDIVKQQDTGKPAPNRARFVGRFNIRANGNSSNGLLGGFLTIAGRVRLNTANGCPETVLLGQDRDPLDRIVGNKELPRKEDPDPDKLTHRTGLAHLIGVVEVVNGGTTDIVLVPYGRMSFHRDLPGVF